MARSRDTDPVTHRDEAGDTVLSGGRMTGGIVRRGDQVRRPMGPWSPAVHEYLRHLESAAFAGAPRVLGTVASWALRPPTRRPTG